MYDVVCKWAQKYKNNGNELVKQFQNLNFNLNLCVTWVRGVSSIKNKYVKYARANENTKPNAISCEQETDKKNKIKANEYRRHRINRQKKWERTEEEKKFVT